RRLLANHYARYAGLGAQAYRRPGSYNRRILFSFSPKKHFQHIIIHKGDGALATISVTGIMTGNGAFQHRALVGGHIAQGGIHKAKGSLAVKTTVIDNMRFLKRKGS